MDEIKNISYEDWLSLISKVMTKGMASKELDEIKVVYPKTAGSSHESMICNQLAKLEEFMVKETINSFQKKMILCGEEMDSEIADIACRKLKKHYDDCMFFMQNPSYPESVKKKIHSEVKRIVTSYIDMFFEDLKKLEYANNSAFVRDYIYICKKKLNRIKKMY